MLDLTNIELALPEEDELALWARIFKAESWDELQKYAAQMTWARKEAEEMVFTMREVTEEERIRWQIQQREDYDHQMASQYEGGFEDGVKSEHEKTLAAEAKINELQDKIAELERRLQK